MPEIRYPLDILNEVLDNLSQCIDEYCEIYGDYGEHERIIGAIERNPTRCHRNLYWHIEQNGDFIVCQSYKNGLEILTYNEIELHETEDISIVEMAEEEFDEIMNQWYVTIHPTLNIRNELTIDYLSVTSNEDQAHIGCVNIPLPSPIVW